MNWCRSIRNILVKYNLRSVWEDEKKLWNIDNSGNGEAKSLKDHKRFLRKFFRGKILDHEEQKWRVNMLKTSLELM